ncbi:MAG: oxidoreductase [Flavobacteriaceae bacterium]|nr:MAG: oxidoreductase [Flavobacteriaceae bacterium]
MRHLFIVMIICLLVSCIEEEESHHYTAVSIETIYQDSISIRAIEILDGSLAFAANNGVFGSVDLDTDKVRTNVQQYDTILPSFRAVAHTATDFFMLSIANPALLYKTGNSGQMELVYTEIGETVFYDAMTFWNNNEGIAVGDSMNGCLSIIITRDAGRTWNKLSCSILPKSTKEEGAFAASNTNIAVVGNKTWIGTTAGRVYYSPNKGETWEYYQTPMINAEPTQGIYSLAFYDEHIGFAIGGDYTKPKNNTANKSLTKDGGKTWELIADGQEPGYRSCVQFVPNTGGKDIVAIGFTGISYSSDMGNSWEQLSSESFYTLRFLNDSIAYAAGKNQIAKLVFK